ncbi:DUF892 family protein [Flavobacterium sp.]|uniref:DUF892 family protein n=1 Tax=Flavobacterium sp. TaxID=239 RepID=UPI002869F60B|nr:DUF892 family protein [Flavobacterium sp.]
MITTKNNQPNQNKTDNSFQKHIESKNCNAFLDELIDIYNSEKNLNVTLPEMIKNAHDTETEKALTTHLKFTQEHIKRLEDFFVSINQPVN